jgi:hypothetical protein
MNATDDFNLAPSLPGWLLYPSTLVLAVLLCVVLYRSRVRQEAFSIFVPWFRYVVSTYHTITFQPAVAGLSWNALGSSGIFVLGLLTVKPRDFALKLLLPCYFLMGVVALSGLANRDIGGTIDSIVKLGFLVVLSLSFYEALGQVGEKRATTRLLWAFVPPLVFQVFSVVFGIAKATETDGSTSYIGGYNHEAAFSIILATCLFVSAIATSLNRWLRFGILVACIVGILLANYRTTILAVAPLIVAQFSSDVLGRFNRRQRTVIGIFVGFFSVMIVCIAGWVLRDRFADLATVLESGTELMKRPELYTRAEVQMLSARPYIWSYYIYGYLDGGTLQHLIGFGGDSWDGVFLKYAHNTLVSSLYEYGIAGVIAFPYLWLSMLFAAMRVRHPARAKLVGAHLSFMLLNMATMPHWMIEGDILYGLICGYTFHCLLRPQTATSPARAMKTSRARPVVPQPAAAQTRRAV